MLPLRSYSTTVLLPPAQVLDAPLVYTTHIEPLNAVIESGAVTGLPLGSSTPAALANTLCVIDCAPTGAAYGIPTESKQVTTIVESRRITIPCAPRINADRRYRVPRTHCGPDKCLLALIARPGY